MDSLHTLKPSDVAVRRPQRRWRDLIEILIRWAALLVCIAVLVGSLISISGSLVDYGEADSFYDDLADRFGDLNEGSSNPFGPAILANKSNPSGATPEYGVESDGVVDKIPGEDGDSSVESDTMIQLRAKLGALKAQNSDLLGWISIPNTKIDYPVVQTVDNEYYLHHSFDRNYLRAGSIYVDYRNSKDLSENRNTIVYGHNMSTGAMFNNVSKFLNRTFFNANRYIYIYTEKGIYVYQTFSIRKVRIDRDLSYITTYFASDEEYVAFLNAQKKASAIKVNDVELDADDQIITLSTCTNTNDNERYSLQAVLVEIRK